MRAFWAVLLFLPLAGCLGGTASNLETLLFTYDAIARGDPAPVAADDCISLLDDLNRRAYEEARVRLHQSIDGHGRYGGMLDDVAAETDGAGAPTMSATQTGAPSARDADVTGTNNQESGADEADVLKTDGEWTYVLSGSKVYILHSSTVGDLSHYANISLAGSHGNGQLLLEARDPGNPDDDRLVVIAGVYRDPEQPTTTSTTTSSSSDAVGGIYYPYGGTTFTQVSVYDLSDRSAPALESQALIEGSHVAGRLIDGIVHVVVQDWTDIGLRSWASPDEDELRSRGLTWETYWNLKDDARRQLHLEIAQDVLAANRDRLDDLELSDHLPTIFQGGDQDVASRSYDNAACRNVLLGPDGTGRGVTTIHSIDVAAASLPAQTVQILGTSPIVYASTDALVLAAPSQDDWWFWAQPELEEATDLHWFDLDGLEVTHRASGRVAGIVQDSFGLDVAGNELRVATTTGQWGRWWLEDPDPMMNHLATLTALGGVLVPTGIVGGIAPGERLWSARFTDDRAYLVTFEQVDPLWIIDLSGDAPTILGELEVPGVSTYLHPINDEVLLTIGIGPRDDGTGLDWSRIQVSLFDTRDATDPRLAAVLPLSPGGDGWSFSAAVDEHKAFTYWDALGKLAVPMSTTHSECFQEADKRTCVEEQDLGLRLVDVDIEELTLASAGGIDQDVLLPEDQGRYGYDWWGLEVERSYFLGFPDGGPVSVYSMSRLGMTAHDLADLALQDSIAFDWDEPVYYLDDGCFDC